MLYAKYYMLYENIMLHSLTKNHFPHLQDEFLEFSTWSKFGDTTLHKSEVIEVFPRLHFLNNPCALASHLTEPEKLFITFSLIFNVNI